MTWRNLPPKRSSASSTRAWPPAAWTNASPATRPPRPRGREAARRPSPLRNPPRHALPVLVAAGGAEPPLWVRRSKDYAALCREHGLEREYMELPGHDHFEVSRAVGDAESPLARAMRGMMEL